MQRRNNDLLIRHVDLLREAVKSVRQRYPFTIHGWVVLPGHMHCVIELPPNKADFAMRWRLIKMPGLCSWVKQGLVERVSDWPSSTFHRFVERGIYSVRVGRGNDVALVDLD